jgi:hypothetical protein
VYSVLQYDEDDSYDDDLYEGVSAVLRTANAGLSSLFKIDSILGWRSPIDLEPVLYVCVCATEKKKERKSKVLAVMAFDAGDCLVESRYSGKIESLAQMQSDPRIISNCL